MLSSAPNTGNPGFGPTSRSASGLTWVWIGTESIMTSDICGIEPVWLVSSVAPRRDRIRAPIRGLKPTATFASSLRDEGRVLQHHQQFLDFLEPRAGFLFGEPREFGADHDVVVVAAEHEFVLFHLDGGNRALGGQEFQFGYLQ